MAACLLPWALGIALILSVIFAIIRKGRIDLWHFISFLTIGAGITGGTVVVGAIILPKLHWPYLDTAVYQVIGGISTIFVSAQTAWRRLRAAARQTARGASVEAAAAHEDEEDQ